MTSSFGMGNLQVVAGGLVQDRGVIGTTASGGTFPTCRAFRTVETWRHRPLPPAFGLGVARGGRGGPRPPPPPGGGWDPRPGAALFQGAGPSAGWNRAATGPCYPLLNQVSPGRTRVNTAPPSGRLWAVMLPPWSRRTRRQMLSPSPVPVGLVLA